MLPTPRPYSPSDRDRGGDRLAEVSTGAGPLLLVATILAAKLVTVGIVLWISWTPQAGLFVAVTTWHWGLLVAAMVAGPLLFAVRLRRVRARRAELRRAEWMLEADRPVAG